MASKDPSVKTPFFASKETNRASNHLLGIKKPEFSLLENSGFFMFLLCESSIY